jgi:hypothetical protein
MRTKPIFLIFLLSLILFSCSMEKRHYRNGFYTHFHSSEYSETEYRQAIPKSLIDKKEAAAIPQFEQKMEEPLNATSSIVLVDTVSEAAIIDLKPDSVFQPADTVYQYIAPSKKVKNENFQLPAIISLACLILASALVFFIPIALILFLPAFVFAIISLVRMNRLSHTLGKSGIPKTIRRQMWLWGIVDVLSLILSGIVMLAILMLFDYLFGWNIF